MSQSSFSEFREAVNNNPRLGEACRAAIVAGGQGAVIEFGRKNGFQFTEEDALAVMDQAELSDLELELVAGGQQNDTSSNG